jgi:hypothetical protein
MVSACLTFIEHEPLVSYRINRQLPGWIPPLCGLIHRSKRSPSARSIGDTLPQRLAWHQLDFGETPHLAILSTIESGPLWRGRRYLSANLAMSDHLSRAGALGGRHQGLIHLSSLTRPV